MFYMHHYAAKISILHFCTLCNPFLFLKFVAIPEIWCLRPQIICSSFRLTWLSLIGGGSAELSKCGEDHLFNYFFPIFHPELPFLATGSRPDNENRETASEIPARCLRSQYKRSRGERSGFAFTLGHFICLAPELPPLSAMSPPSTSAHLFRWNTFMQSVKVPPHLFHSSTVLAFILSAAFSLYGK